MTEILASWNYGGHSIHSLYSHNWTVIKTYFNTFNHFKPSSLQSGYIEDFTLRIYELQTLDDILEFETTTTWRPEWKTINQAFRCQFFVSYSPCSQYEFVILKEAVVHSFVQAKHNTILINLNVLFDLLIISLSRLCKYEAKCLKLFSYFLFA